MRRLATLANKHQVLPTIDRLVARNKNVIEYIYTRPDWSSCARINDRILARIGTQSAQNPYGHSAVRYAYETNDGQRRDVVMNIARDTLVNFVEPVDYLFAPSRPGNEQGGVFLRSFVTIRIDDVDTESVQALDRFYQQVQQRHQDGTAGFSLFTSMIQRTLARWIGTSMLKRREESGNCAYWTSQGLVRAGLLPGFSNWPLVVLFKLMLAELTRQAHGGGPRVNVISYRSLKHAHEPQGGLIYPFHWLRHSYRPFWSLDKLANIVVKPVPLSGQEDRYTLVVSEDAEAKVRWQRLRDDLMRVRAFTRDQKM